MGYSWDEDRNRTNTSRHGVSFDAIHGFAPDAAAVWEDRTITRAAEADPDALPLTEADIGSGKLLRVRGPQKAPAKRQVTLRLDPDVLARQKANGRGRQTRANALLRDALGLQDTPAAVARPIVPPFMGGLPLRAIRCPPRR